MNHDSPEPLDYARPTDARPPALGAAGVITVAIALAGVLAFLGALAVLCLVLLALAAG